MIFDSLCCRFNPAYAIDAIAAVLVWGPSREMRVPTLAPTRVLAFPAAGRAARGNRDNCNTLTSFDVLPKRDMCPRAGHRSLPITGQFSMPAQRSPERRAIRPLPAGVAGGAKNRPQPDFSPDHLGGRAERE